MQTWSDRSKSGNANGRRTMARNQPRWTLTRHQVGRPRSYSPVVVLHRIHMHAPTRIGLPTAGEEAYMRRMRMSADVNASTGEEAYLRRARLSQGNADILCVPCVLRHSHTYPHSQHTRSAPAESTNVSNGGGSSSGGDTKRRKLNPESRVVLLTVRATMTLIVLHRLLIGMVCATCCVIRIWWGEARSILSWNKKRAMSVRSMARWAMPCRVHRPRVCN